KNFPGTASVMSEKVTSGSCTAETGLTGGGSAGAGGVTGGSCAAATALAAGGSAGDGADMAASTKFEGTASVMSEEVTVCACTTATEPQARTVTTATHATQECNCILPPSLSLLGVIERFLPCM